VETAVAYAERSGSTECCRAILDQLRHELACRHLADSRLSIGEIAFLLGFSEMSAFYRAFKRWTGHTPAEFRAQMRALHGSRAS
jgi:AraC-like DNA-binding protein